MVCIPHLEQEKFAILKHGFAVFINLPWLLLCTSSAASDTPVIVHEWGTITTWHQPDGTPIGRLNRIEESEVLPPFVHAFEPEQTRHNPERLLRKTPLTPGRPDVTMRLETPVMYFYPPQEYSNNQPFTVEVSFRGGVINEFFPSATASVALDMERIHTKLKVGMIPTWNGEVLNNYVRGSIAWSITDLPANASVPETELPVWLAPRNVNSKYVEGVSGETEKYLFYRGVAHLEAMIQTRTLTSEITLLSPNRLHWLPAAKVVIPKAWIVAINEKGEIAFHDVKKLTIRKDAPSSILQSFPSFTENEFQDKHLAELENSMKKALVAEGLFQIEADAMLATWKESYFEEPGKRIFYMVPTEWLEVHLPVKIAIPHKLSRAFIGRIDLFNK